jgi:hypothetical protein
MRTEIWLPLTTLVLGWAGAQGAEILKDRRVSDRERLVRRAESQRSTLLELQHAILKWFGESIFTSMMDYPPAKDGEPVELSSVESARAWGQRMAAIGRVQLLVSRVEDEQVRRLGADLLSSALVLQDRDEDKVAQAFAGIRDGFGPLIARIGELLREKY